MAEDSSRPVLDYWCELQCPDCHRAQADLDALVDRLAREHPAHELARLTADR